MNRLTQQRTSKQRPTKWVLALLGVLMVYALAQPMLNRQFSWHLPSLSALWEQDGPTDPSSGPQDRTDTTLESDATIETDGREKLLYDVLKETSGDNYVSIAGLRYTPGSEEGHRLKHLERHLVDIPSRPGKHGVFAGEMTQVLKWIDDAFERGKRGAKGTRKSDEENATVYEVPFDKPIGYVGGREGGREGHPPARRLRLVVDGNRFITAFPF